MPDYQKRIARVQALMEQKKVDYIFLTASAGGYYLTGIRTVYDERMQLYIVPRQGKLICILPAMIHDFIEAQNDGSWDTHYWVDGGRQPEDMLADYLQKPSRVMVDDLMRTQHCLRILPFCKGAEVLPADALLKECRIYKDPDEIRMLKEAGALADEVMGEILPYLKEGVKEYEIALKIEQLCREKGAEAVSFNPIVCFGPNGCNPHPAYSEAPLQRGQFITLDFGARLNNYCSDTTRTFCLGKATEEMKRIYETVRQANKAAFDACRVGVTCEDVDKAARTVITEAGYGPNFLHRNGHGIGIELHEEPFIVAGNSRPIEAGMTFSNEPGIYIADRLGVRIEDIVAVTADGPVSMNNFTKELIEL